MAFSLKLSSLSANSARNWLPTVIQKQWSSQSLSRCVQQAPNVRLCLGFSSNYSMYSVWPTLLNSKGYYTSVSSVFPYGYNVNHMFNPLTKVQSRSPGAHVQVRTVTKFSKKGKRKTVKAVAKRFYRTGSGKLKYWPAGNVHNMLAKSRKRRLQLRKARYVSKTQLKTLNKMISGW